MIAPVKMWRYFFPNGEKTFEGWAEIVICSSGFFGTVSDYGNYAFNWRHHGCDDIRKFFLNAPRDWDYFARKLGGEHAKIYDGAATLRAISNHILEQRRSKSMSAVEAREEWDLLNGSDINTNSDHGFDTWLSDTRIGDAYEFHCTRINPQLEHFCKVTMARLAEAIRAELEAEGKAA